jgi:hypothetical protein
MPKDLNRCVHHIYLTDSLLKGYWKILRFLAIFENLGPKSSLSGQISLVLFIGWKFIHLIISCEVLHM